MEIAVSKGKETVVSSAITGAETKETEGYSTGWLYSSSAVMVGSEISGAQDTVTRILERPILPFEERMFRENPVVKGLPREAKVWFYHVASCLHEDVPQYEFLRKELFNLGYKYRDAFVVFLVKETEPQIVENLERTLGFGDDNMPCLIISPAMLEVDILSLLEAKAKNATLIKRGVFTNYLLKKEERLVNFIIGLYNAAVKREVDKFLKSKKAKTYLAITGEELKQHTKLPVSL